MDSPGERRKRGLKPLDEAQPGDRLVVVSVFERDRKLLEYLDGAGIRPGVRVEISAVDGEIELVTAGRKVTALRTPSLPPAKVWGAKPARIDTIHESRNDRHGRDLAQARAGL